MVADKFTKWVEAEPVSNCDAVTKIQFVKKLIFCFGYPHSIITDNGKNPSKGAMKEFCQREHIRLDVSLVAHPQSNGHVEHANQEKLWGIKPWLIVPLEQTSGCRVEELPTILWSIRTTPNRSIGYTPFFMVYGAEAVLPSDIRHDLPGWRLTLKQTMRRRVKTLWTPWIKNMISQQLDRRFTNKTCVTIIATEFEAGRSRKAT